MTYRFRPLLLLSFVLVFAGSAVAGPPLICHPFEIGAARSLPWNGPGWPDVDPLYDLTHLADDTLSLLTAQTPVLARMETLRRATVYARSNPEAAAQLLARLQQRTTDRTRGSQELAAALFDAGYLTETYKQAAWISANAHEDFWKFRQVSPREDGYSQMTRAIAMTGDPAMEFAAALVTTDRRTYGETTYRAHLKRAIAAVPEGTLLGRNLTAHFGEAEVRELRSAAARTR